MMYEKLKYLIFYWYICMTSILVMTCQKSNTVPVKIIENRIDLKTAAPHGLYILEDYTGTPDSAGVFESFDFVLPRVTRGCNLVSGWRQWYAPGNSLVPYSFKDSLASFKYGSLMVIFELTDGSYLTILPLVGEQSIAWLHAEDNVLKLSVGNLGNERVTGDIPLFAWAKSGDVYLTMHHVWDEIARCKLMNQSVTLRHKKPYPEFAKYLGWCSYEHYKANITSDLMVDAANRIKESDIPIRYFLLDWGHHIKIDEKLGSLTPDPEKFPEGFTAMLNTRDESTLKWFGVWHAFMGVPEGISAQNDFPENKKAVLNEFTPETVAPDGSKQAAETFYNFYYENVENQGFDFVKIDFQNNNLGTYAYHTGNAILAANNNAQALEKIIHDRFEGLINCWTMGALPNFNKKYSNISRVSWDYRKYHWKGIPRTRTGFHNTLWMGHVAWPDHDMFHSNDSISGQYQATARALSGGPVYLSDEPGTFKKENIMSLCYEDGELIRALAPGVPLPNSIFMNASEEKTAYKTIAPLSNFTAAIAAYNLSTDNEIVQGTISSDDYQYASAMIQPYPGPWKIPDEGLVIYDWYYKTAEKLENQIHFELDYFSCKFFLLCPIQTNWAIIGLIDKLLSPACVEIIKIANDKVILKLIESGPIALWSAIGEPKTEGYQFKDKGSGLWVCDLPVGQKNVVLTIYR